MVWKAFFSVLIELRPKAISREIPVLTGTVIATRIRVFFSAWIKNGSLSTWPKLPSPMPV